MDIHPSTHPPTARTHIVVGTSRCTHTTHDTAVADCVSIDADLHGQFVRLCLPNPKRAAGCRNGRASLKLTMNQLAGPLALQCLPACLSASLHNLGEISQVKVVLDTVVIGVIGVLQLGKKLARQVARDQLVDDDGVQHCRG